MTLSEELEELAEAFTHLKTVFIAEIIKDFNRIKALVQKKKSK